MRDIIGAVATDEHVRATLRSVWQLAAETCVPAGDSSGSEWSVTIDGRRYTVRIAPPSQRHDLVASLAIAETLDGAGIAVGRPVRTVDGALTATTSAGDMAVLLAVPGRPLDANDPLDQQWWGDLLGRAHRVLLRSQAGVPVRLGLPAASGPHLGVAPWLRAALADVSAAVTRLLVTDQVTYGVLHRDPRASGFRLDPGTGRTGLDGWGAPRVGPLVYDIAVAVRDAGGVAAAGDFIDGYVSAGPVTADEIAATLPVMLRLHWALIAEDRAREIAAGGSDGSAGDRAGSPEALDEARRVLAALAIEDQAE
jgi:Ser/Thr protein kinase RdoA (MazF antagonist)